MGMNIMVVDYEQSIADLIEVYLKMKVKQYKFYNGQYALRCVKSERLDLAIPLTFNPRYESIEIYRGLFSKEVRKNT